MGNYKKWTDSEIDYIRDNHVSTPDEELAVKMSQMTSQAVTTAMIRRQRRKLKLSKPRGRPSKNKLPTEKSIASVSVEPTSSAL